MHVLLCAKHLQVYNVADDLNSRPLESGENEFYSLDTAIIMPRRGLKQSLSAMVL